MAVLACVNLINVEVDTEVTPMICKPFVCIWIPGFFPVQDFLPGAYYEATPEGKANANAGIVAAAQAVCEAAPYNLVFNALDSVQLIRGVDAG